MNALEALNQIKAIDRNEKTETFWCEIDRLVMMKCTPRFEDDPDGFEINLENFAVFRVSARAAGYRIFRWTYRRSLYNSLPTTNETAAAAVFEQILDFLTSPKTAKV